MSEFVVHNIHIKYNILVAFRCVFDCLSVAFRCLSVPLGAFLCLSVPFGIFDALRYLDVPCRRPYRRIGVRKGHSHDMPAEGSIFDVSPDIPGFHMRPAGGGVQPADINQPPPPNYVGFNNPFFGAPIAFTQCQNTSGMDTTTTLPIYSIPKDSSFGIDQSAVPTVYASGVSPDTIPWSTAEDIRSIRFTQRTTNTLR